MDVIHRVTGPGDPAFITANLSAIGTAQFSALIPVLAGGGTTKRRAKAIRIKGRVVAPAAGGALVIRACAIDDGIVPSAGAGAGESLVCRNTIAGGETDSPNLATTAARAFSATYYLPSLPPLPGTEYSLRLTNPTTAYSGGQVIVDEVELLA